MENTDDVESLPWYRKEFIRSGKLRGTATLLACVEAVCFVLFPNYIFGGYWSRISQIYLVSLAIRFSSAMIVGALIYGIFVLLDIFTSD